MSEQNLPNDPQTESTPEQQSSLEATAETWEDIAEMAKLSTNFQVDELREALASSLEHLDKSLNDLLVEYDRALKQRAKAFASALSEINQNFEAEIERLKTQYLEQDGLSNRKE